MAKGPASSQHYLECDNCEENPAKFICKTCAGYLCKPCKNKHKIKKINRNHEILSLNSNSDEMLDLFLCPKHVKKKLECYCTPCSEPVCTDCIIQSHIGHSMESMSKVHQRITEYSKQKREQIENVLLPSHADLLAKEEEKRSALKKKADEIQEKIDAHTQSIVDIVKHIGQQTVVDLRKTEREGLQEMNTFEKNLEEKISKLQLMSKQLSANLEAKPQLSIFKSIDREDLKSLQALPHSVEYTLTDYQPYDMDIENMFGKSPVLDITRSKNRNVSKDQKPLNYTETEGPLDRKPLNYREKKGQRKLRSPPICKKGKDLTNQEPLSYIEIEGPLENWQPLHYSEKKGQLKDQKPLNYTETEGPLDRKPLNNREKRGQRKLLSPQICKKGKESTGQEPLNYIEIAGPLKDQKPLNYTETEGLLDRKPLNNREKRGQRKLLSPQICKKGKESTGQEPLNYIEIAGPLKDQKPLNYTETEGPLDRKPLNNREKRGQRKLLSPQICKKGKESTGQEPFNYIEIAGPLKDQKPLNYTEAEGPLDWKPLNYREKRGQRKLLSPQICKKGKESTDQEPLNFVTIEGPLEDWQPLHHSEKKGHLRSSNVCSAS